MPSSTGAGASEEDALRHPATPLVRAPPRTDLRRARVANAAELAKMVSKAKLCRRIRGHKHAMALPRHITRKLATKKPALCSESSLPLLFSTKSAVVLPLCIFRYTTTPQYVERSHFVVIAGYKCSLLARSSTVRAIFRAMR